MAETALTVLDDDDAPLDDRRLTLDDILQAENIAELLEPNALLKIGQNCLVEFDQDEDSRKDFRERYRRAMDVAMQVREDKNWPWPEAFNMKYPLVTVAAIQFQARAYPAIVDGANLVKGRVLGEDKDGSKRVRADRIGAHMTWQLLHQMPAWEEDTDRLLLMLPIVGCVFRKTYYDTILQSNVSATVPADDFVVNYWAKSLDTVPRYTHVIRFYPHEVIERVNAGLWLDVPLPNSETDKDRSETAPIEFLEQHCRLDLDEDGYPEPYIVTLVRDSGAVTCIRACFDPEGVTMKDGRDGPRVIRIERTAYFTKYGFIPSPDGSFYDVGFGTLLNDLTEAIDATINQMLDAGTLQNAGGGLIGSGINIKSGPIRMSLGKWTRVDVTGGALAQNIYPFNQPGPSPVLFTLLNMLIEAAKEITSVQDVLTGASQGLNTPATTVLAQIEQAQKVMTAIFKRIHRAFGKELAILFRLNREYLDDEAYFALTDQPGQVGRADYQDKDLDVVPMSDPTAVNDMQKAARAQVLMSFQGNPLVNQVEIVERVMQSTGQADIPKLLEVPQPAPDPKMLLDGMKEMREKALTQSNIRAQDAATARSLVETAKLAAELGVITTNAAMRALAADLAAESEQLTAGVMRAAANDTGEMGDGAEHADEPGGVQPMDGAPGDTGVPGIPGEAPVEPDAGVGDGAAIDAGGPVGGVPLQPDDGFVG